LDCTHVLLQAITLLQNNATATPWGAGAPLLPLNTSAIARLAVIGPNANATQTLLGNYHGVNTLVNGHGIIQVWNDRHSGPVIIDRWCALGRCRRWPAAAWV
jgi:beta-glucosidase-like glycosyl hydrolase